MYPRRYEEGTERGLPTGEGTYLAVPTINFEIFDLRSVSLAFRVYACEQWPPTPRRAAPRAALYLFAESTQHPRVRN